MNKIATLLIITTIFSLNAHPVQSATITTSPTSSTATSSADESTGEKLNQQINQLKERIASRVAELNLVEKRGIIATVSQTSGNQITITDLAGKTRYVDVDEITKFSSEDSKDFGLSDLTKGTKISVLGLYNKQTQRILARYIETYSTPIYLSGKIAEIDKENFQITITAEDQKQTKVDIQNITVTSTHTKEDGITKSGFSKLNVADKVIVNGFPDQDDASLVAASRVLVLNELPPNPKIIINQQPEEESEETTPTP